MSFDPQTFAAELRVELDAIPAPAVPVALPVAQLEPGQPLPIEVKAMPAPPAWKLTPLRDPNGLIVTVLLETVHERD